ncbi:MAG: hypothetical protein IGR92_11240 [Leptolyngbyaceae cyanobacterium T60_A2020_046]|nr:hypothetical protein [Leptolyngbyaceae cyanobacterium T60_A2020_046]
MRGFGNRRSLTIRTRRLGLRIGFNEQRSRWLGSRRLRLRKLLANIPA